MSIAALFFRGPIFAPNLFHIPYDLEFYHYSLTVLIASTLKNFGHLPWWNPYSYMGESFAGNPQSALFYPPTLITALLGNVIWGHVSLWLVEVNLVVHMAVAGFGAYLFMRSLGATHRSSLAGCSLYELGAFFASQAQHLGAVEACAWLPFFLLSLYRLTFQRNLRWAAISAVFLALMILPGFPAAYLPVFVIAPFLYFWWLRGQGKLARPILRFACVFLIGILLATVSWLPAYRTAANSLAARRGFQGAVTGLPAHGLTSLIWPNLYGQLRGDYWLPVESPTMVYYYQGVVALIVLFGGFAWLARSAAAIPFLFAGAASFLWMLGQNSFLSLMLYLSYPTAVRRGIYPFCLLAYFSLFLAILCSLALSAYERAERRELAASRPIIIAASTAAALGVIVCMIGAFAANGSPVPARAVEAGGSLLMVSLWLALAWIVLRDQRDEDTRLRRRVVAILCGLIVLDLVGTSSHGKINVNDGPGAQRPDAVAFIQTQLGVQPAYRVDTSDMGYDWQTSPPLWPMPSANGSNPLLSDDVRAYRSLYSTAWDQRQFSITDCNSPLLDLSGVRYVLTYPDHDKVCDFPAVFHGDANVFENVRAFPRFFLVGGVAVSADFRDAARKIHWRQVDARKVAVVDVADAPKLAMANSTEHPGDVTVIHVEPNEIRLQTRAAARAVLIATESYSREWEATEDGRRIPLVRADGVFRAVPVSPGTHEIRMRIVPRAVYQGAAISLAALLACIGCIVFGGATVGRASDWEIETFQEPEVLVFK